MRVITFGNEKGGVGKTTTCINVAAGLAIRGYRVLVIDTDAQGNCAPAFGLPKEHCFYDLMVRNAPWKEMLRFVPTDRYVVPDEADAVTGSLFILPGNDETRGITNQISDSFVLIKRLKEVEDVFDYVLLDTMPTPSMLHSLVYVATSEYVYVTLCEQWSMDGLAESIQRLEGFNPVRVSRGLEPVHIIGVLPTKYRVSTVEHQENLKILQQHLPGLVMPPIADRIAWAEASRLRCPLFRMYPDPAFPATADAWRVVDIIEGVTVNE